jgi:hypothetical protein
VGKSAVLLDLREYLEQNQWGHTMLVVSHTGAAVSRVGGYTIDSVLGTCKKGVPDESLGRTKTGRVKQRRTYNKQLCEERWGNICIVMVEEAWTTSSSQVANLHRLFHSRAGGPADLYFGGVLFVWFGDPMQLGPHAASVPLLPIAPHGQAATEPGPNDEGFGQWHATTPSPRVREPTELHW